MGNHREQEQQLPSLPSSKSDEEEPVETRELGPDEGPETEQQPGPLEHGAEKHYDFGFHSPLDLLRDPHMYSVLRPGLGRGAAAGAAAGVGAGVLGRGLASSVDDVDDVDDGLNKRFEPEVQAQAQAQAENTPLPESGPASPGERELPEQVSAPEQKPEATEKTDTSLPSVLDATVAAAVGAGIHGIDKSEGAEKSFPKTEPEETGEKPISVPVPVPTESDTNKAEPESVVDAAVAAATGGAVSQQEVHDSQPSDSTCRDLDLETERPETTDKEPETGAVDWASEAEAEAEADAEELDADAAPREEFEPEDDWSTPMSGFDNNLPPVPEVPEAPEVPEESDPIQLPSVDDDGDSETAPFPDFDEWAAPPAYHYPGAPGANYYFPNGGLATIDELPEEAEEVQPKGTVEQTREDPDNAQVETGGIREAEPVPEAAIEPLAGDVKVADREVPESIPEPVVVDEMKAAEDVHARGVTEPKPEPELAPEAAIEPLAADVTVADREIPEPVVETKPAEDIQGDEREIPQPASEPIMEPLAADKPGTESTEAVPGSVVVDETKPTDAEREIPPFTSDKLEPTAPEAILEPLAADVAPAITERDIPEPVVESRQVDELSGLASDKLESAPEPVIEPLAGDVKVGGAEREIPESTTEAIPEPVVETKPESATEPVLEPLAAEVKPEATEAILEPVGQTTAENFQGTTDRDLPELATDKPEAGPEPIIEPLAADVKPADREISEPTTDVPAAETKPEDVQGTTERGLPESATDKPEQTTEPIEPLAADVKPESTAEPVADKPTEDAHEESRKSKKNKKKKNKRKSSHATDQPQPEASQHEASQPETSQSAMETDLTPVEPAEPQTSGEIHQPPQPQPPSDEPASLRDVEAAAAAAEPEPIRAVDRDEANEDAPHVLGPTGVEVAAAAAPAVAAPATTPTDTQDHHDGHGEKEYASDEAAAAAARAPVDSSPPANPDYFQEDVNAPRVDATPAPSDQEPLPVPPFSSTSSTTPVEGESQPPAEKSIEEEEAAAAEALQLGSGPEMSRGATEVVEDHHGAEVEVDEDKVEAEPEAETDAPTMTAAQKKKAKKDRKKKRQSASIDESATATSAPAVTEPQSESLLPSSTDDAPATQEAKDVPTEVPAQDVARESTDDNTSATRDIEPTHSAEPAQEGTDVIANDVEMAAPSPAVENEPAVGVDASASASEGPEQSSTTTLAQDSVPVPGPVDVDTTEAVALAPAGVPDFTETETVEAVPASEHDSTREIPGTEAEGGMQESTHERESVPESQPVEPVEPVSSKSKKKKNKKKHRHSSSVDEGQAVTEAGTEAPAVTSEPVTRDVPAEQSVPETGLAEGPAETEETLDIPSEPLTRDVPVEQSAPETGVSEVPAATEETEKALDVPSEPLTREASGEEPVPEESRAIDTPVTGVDSQPEQQLAEEQPAPEASVTETPAEAEKTLDIPPEPLTGDVPAEQPAPETGLDAPVATEEAEKTPATALDLQPEQPPAQEQPSRDEKRKSVTFDTEEPQVSEAVDVNTAEPETREPVSVSEEPAQPGSASTEEFQTVDTPLDTPVEPVKPEEPETQEKSREIEDVAPQVESTETTANDNEPQPLIAPKPLAEPEPQAAPELSGHTQSAQDSAEPQIEAVEPEPLSKSLLPEETTKPTEPTAEHETEPHTPVEPEHEATSSKSKKKKNKKKNRKAAEAHEEAGTDPVESQEKPVEEKPVEAVEPVPAVNEPQEYAASAEAQEPEAEVQEREVPKEAEPMSTEPVEAKEPETAPETVPSEPTEPAVTAEPELQHMSAKAKKKAKKDKKRQSKNLETTPVDVAPDSEPKDEPRDEAKDSEAQAAEHTPETPLPSVETEPTPVNEESGNEHHQSRDAGELSTDQLVSSQVEESRQPETSGLSSGIGSEQKSDVPAVPELVPLPEGEDALEEDSVKEYAGDNVLQSVEVPEAPLSQDQKGKEVSGQTPGIDWNDHDSSTDTLTQTQAPAAEEARPADSTPLAPDIGSDQNYKLQGTTGTRGLESTTSDPQDPENDNNTKPPQGPSADPSDKGSVSVAEAVLGMRRMGGRVSSLFPDLKRSGFRRTPSNESVKDRAEDETREPEVSRDLDDENERAIRVSEAPITSLPTPGDGSTSVVEPAESEAPTSSDLAIDVEVEGSCDVSILSDDAATTTSVSRGIDVDAKPDEKEEEKEEEDEDKGEREKVEEEEEHDERPPAPSPTPTATIRKVSPELRRSPTVIYGSHEPTPRSWSLDDDHDPTTQQERSGPGEPAGHAEQARTMGSPAGTSRLEMKPEHVLQPRPQTPPAANDQHTEPVKTPGRSVSQPRPSSGANIPTPDQQQPSMRRPGSMGSMPTTTATPIRSRNNSVVQLQTPKSPRTPQRQPTSSNGSSIGSSPNAAVAPRALRRTSGTARTPSNDLRSASRALEESGAAKKPPQPPEFRSTDDVNLEHIASSSSYDPVTDKGKRPVRGMSDVIVSISS